MSIYSALSLFCLAWHLLMSILPYLYDFYWPVRVSSGENSTMPSCLIKPYLARMTACVWVAFLLAVELAVPLPVALPAVALPAVLLPAAAVLFALDEVLLVPLDFLSDAAYSFSFFSFSSYSSFFSFSSASLSFSISSLVMLSFVFLLGFFAFFNLTDDAPR